MPEEDRTVRGAQGARAPKAAKPGVSRGAVDAREPQDPYIRAENEDDDGYDPYSDRRPDPEPLFEPDPWA